MDGDGKSEFKLPHGSTVRFVMPLPFQAYFFIDAPAEDVRVTAANLARDDLAVEAPDLVTVMRQSLDAHSHRGREFNVNISIIVPTTGPASDDTMKMVGKTNPNAIQSRRNT